MTDPVIYERRAAIAIMTLNRPEAHNSIDSRMAEALRDALKRFEADDTVRVGILAATGRSFCAGMDLKAFLAGEGENILNGEGRFAGFVDAKRTKPLIAVIEGPALAGGFELALACDFIIASETASFGLPEVGVGIFACAGGTFRLARRIPPAKALELCLTAARISASDADGLGLLNRLTAPGEALVAAEKLAGQISANAPLAVAASLEIGRTAQAVADIELWALTDRLWRDVAASQDAAEGPRAFAEKRKPIWQGA
ncbi:crotonase/enoyl-CoA hydratase family protein [uncultured Roseovarius sp.]|uniref:crotonase/enoyl-CoA hydratase family protein n=1 Tax=Roseovarius sp. TaxID=1486281 RepID=UPI0025D53ABA|nr:crotonase/enoyl-CoA hydratase family protein [uncultured Roseovarius sp.]